MTLIVSTVTVVVASLLLKHFRLPGHHHQPSQEEDTNDDAIDNGTCEEADATLAQRRLVYVIWIVAVSTLALLAGKALMEVRAASKVCRKLRRKLEASFDRPSRVDDAWMRAGAESIIGVLGVGVNVCGGRTAAGSETTGVGAGVGGGAGKELGRADGAPMAKGSADLLTVRECQRQEHCLLYINLRSNRLYKYFHCSSTVWVFYSYFYR